MKRRRSIFVKEVVVAVVILVVVVFRLAGVFEIGAVITILLSDLFFF